jgi:hypothetical protein
MSIVQLIKYFLILLPLGVCLICTLAAPAQQSRHPKAKRVGKPLGPETEAFFDEVAKRKRQLPPGGASAEDPRPLADLNGDGRCDRADLRLFRRAAGKRARAGGPAFIAYADLDGDGRVTREDGRSFLQLWRGCKARQAGR